MWGDEWEPEEGRHQIPDRKPLPLPSCSWQMLTFPVVCALTLGIFARVVSSNGLISRCAV